MVLNECPNERKCVNIPKRDDRHFVKLIEKKGRVPITTKTKEQTLLYYKHVKKNKYLQHK